MEPESFYDSAIPQGDLLPELIFSDDTLKIQQNCETVTEGAESEEIKDVNLDIEQNGLNSFECVRNEERNFHDQVTCSVLEQESAGRCDPGPQSEMTVGSHTLPESAVKNTSENGEWIASSGVTNVHNDRILSNVKCLGPMVEQKDALNVVASENVDVHERVVDNCIAQESERRKNSRAKKRKCVRIKKMSRPKGKVASKDSDVSKNKSEAKGHLETWEHEQSHCEQCVTETTGYFQACLESEEGEGLQTSKNMKSQELENMKGTECIKCLEVNACKTTVDVNDAWNTEVTEMCVPEEHEKVRKTETASAEGSVPEQASKSLEKTYDRSDCKDLPTATEKASAGSDSLPSEQKNFDAKLEDGFVKFSEEQFKLGAGDVTSLVGPDTLQQCMIVNVHTRFHCNDVPTVGEQDCKQLVKKPKIKKVKRGTLKNSEQNQIILRSKVTCVQDATVRELRDCQKRKCMQCKDCPGSIEVTKEETRRSRKRSKEITESKCLELYSDLGVKDSCNSGDKLALSKGTFVDDTEHINEVEYSKPCTSVKPEVVEKEDMHQEIKYSTRLSKATPTKCAGRRKKSTANCKKTAKNERRLHSKRESELSLTRKSLENNVLQESGSSCKEPQEVKNQLLKSCISEADVLVPMFNESAKASDRSAVSRSDFLSEEKILECKENLNNQTVCENSFESSNGVSETILKHSVVLAKGNVSCKESSNAVDEQKSESLTENLYDSMKPSCPEIQSVVLKKTVTESELSCQTSEKDMKSYLVEHKDEGNLEKLQQHPSACHMLQCTSEAELYKAVNDTKSLNERNGDSLQCDIWKKSTTLDSLVTPVSKDIQSFKLGNVQERCNKKENDVECKETSRIPKEDIKAEYLIHDEAKVDIIHKDNVGTCEDGKQNSDSEYGESAVAVLFQDSCSIMLKEAEMPVKHKKNQDSEDQNSKNTCKLLFSETGFNTAKHGNSEGMSLLKCEDVEVNDGRTECKRGILSECSEKQSGGTDKDFECQVVWETSSVQLQEKPCSTRCEGGMRLRSDEEINQEGMKIRTVMKGKKGLLVQKTVSPKNLRSEVNFVCSKKDQGCMECLLNVKHENDLHDSQEQGNLDYTVNANEQSVNVGELSKGDVTCLDTEVYTSAKLVQDKGIYHGTVITESDGDVCHESDCMILEQSQEMDHPKDVFRHNHNSSKHDLVQHIKTEVVLDYEPEEPSGSQTSFEGTECVDFKRNFPMDGGCMNEECQIVWESSRAQCRQTLDGGTIGSSQTNKDLVPSKRIKQGKRESVIKLKKRVDSTKLRGKLYEKIMGHETEMEENVKCDVKCGADHKVKRKQMHVESSKTEALPGLQNVLQKECGIQVKENKPKLKSCNDEGNAKKSEEFCGLSECQIASTKSLKGVIKDMKNESQLISPSSVSFEMTEQSEEWNTCIVPKKDSGLSIENCSDKCVESKQLNDVGTQTLSNNDHMEFELLQSMHHKMGLETGGEYQLVQITECDKNYKFIKSSNYHEKLEKRKKSVGHSVKPYANISVDAMGSVCQMNKNDSEDYDEADTAVCNEQDSRCSLKATEEMACTVNNDTAKDKCNVVDQMSNEQQGRSDLGELQVDEVEALSWEEKQLLEIWPEEDSEEQNESGQLLARDGAQHLKQTKDTNYTKARNNASSGNTANLAKTSTVIQLKRENPANDSADKMDMINERFETLLQSAVRQKKLSLGQGFYHGKVYYDPYHYSKFPEGNTRFVPGGRLQSVSLISSENCTKNTSMESSSPWITENENSVNYQYDALKAATLQETLKELKRQIQIGKTEARKLLSYKQNDAEQLQNNEGYSHLKFQKFEGESRSVGNTQLLNSLGQIKRSRSYELGSNDVRDSSENDLMQKQVSGEATDTGKRSGKSKQIENELHLLQYLNVLEEAVHEAEPPDTSTNTSHHKKLKLEGDNTSENKVLRYQCGNLTCIVPDENLGSSGTVEKVHQYKEVGIRQSTSTEPAGSFHSQGCDQKREDGEISSESESPGVHNESFQMQSNLDSAKGTKIPLKNSGPVLKQSSEYSEKNKMKYGGSFQPHSASSKYSSVSGSNKYRNSHSTPQHYSNYVSHECKNSGKYKPSSFSMESRYTSDTENLNFASKLKKVYGLKYDSKMENEINRVSREVNKRDDLSSVSERGKLNKSQLASVDKWVESKKERKLVQGQAVYEQSNVQQKFKKSPTHYCNCENTGNESKEKLEGRIHLHRDKAKHSTQNLVRRQLEVISSYVEGRQNESFRLKHIHPSDGRVMEKKHTECSENFGKTEHSFCRTHDLLHLRKLRAVIDELEEETGYISHKRGGSSPLPEDITPRRDRISKLPELDLPSKIMQHLKPSFVKKSKCCKSIKRSPHPAHSDGDEWAQKLQSHKGRSHEKKRRYGEEYPCHYHNRVISDEKVKSEDDECCGAKVTKIKCCKHQKLEKPKKFHAHSQTEQPLKVSCGGSGAKGDDKRSSRDVELNAEKKHSSQNPKKRTGSRASDLSAEKMLKLLIRNTEDPEDSLESNRDKGNIIATKETLPKFKDKTSVTPTNEKSFTHSCSPNNPEKSVAHGISASEEDETELQKKKNLENIKDGIIDKSCDLLKNYWDLFSA